MTTLAADPETLARAWMAVDPDPDTRSETERLLAAGGAELAERFGDHLRFGTAGLRGRIGPGPLAMNRVLVRLAAAAVADEVRAGSEGADGEIPLVVVGFDARHGSADFADDTARVMVARGLRCVVLPRALPTPVLAFAVRHLGAAAGVMVTASHNPRLDNGYKVYWSGGSLLTAPTDTRIAERMAALDLLGDDDLSPDPPERAAATVIDDYVATVVAALDPSGSRSAVVAYTPLHGVGGAIVEAAFAAAGFGPPAVAPAQADPDPDFPTTPFPNPEETGALDLVLARGDEVEADVALANDPDADRLAVAVRHEAGWRLLTGDDLGCLLAEHLLGRASTDTSGAPALVINTIVSSPLLARIADHHGAEHVETLTGFKWIMAARADREDQRFVLGYEEALGYAVTDHVRDKDGISAALVVAELVSELKDEGRTLLDLLDDVHRRHGVHVDGQRSLRFEDTPGEEPAMRRAMAALRSDPPAALAGMAVTSVVDLATGSTGLPPTDGVVLGLDGGRLVVRPSGTEPKMKVYGEVVAPAPGAVAPARAEAGARLRRLVDAAALAVADAERGDRPGGRSGGDDTAHAERAAAMFGAAGAGPSRADDLRLVTRCIDLTTLEGDDTPARVRALCARARRPDAGDPTVGPVAAVCVYPALVPVARAIVSEPVRVASVAGAFPSGLSAPAVREADITAAVAAGADEIDIVLDRSAFLAGRIDVAEEGLRRARSAAAHTTLKTIIEVGELGTVGAIREATRLAIATGADFVKTSTGKTAVNATPAAVLAMAEELAAHEAATGRRVGLKIAGGVRTAADALGYVAIVRTVLGDDWLTPELLRFGASSLLDDLLDALAAAEAPPSGG